MTKRETVRRIFIGADGVRPGWRLALFITLTVLSVVVAALTAFGPKGPPHGVAPLRQFVMFEMIHASGLIGATALLGWMERRSVLSYGLRERHAPALAAAGFVGGFASLSVLAGMLMSLGALHVDGVALTAGRGVVYAAGWLAVFLLVGLAEEMADRGYFLTSVARRLGFWPAALVTSAAFTLFHVTNGGETLLGLTQVFAAGIGLCVLLRATGSLWASIGFHAGWDWAQSYVYGTPDSGFRMEGHLLATHAAGSALISGGTDGPEGSVFAAAIFLIGTVLVAWVLQRAVPERTGGRVSNPERGLGDT